MPTMSTTCLTNSLHESAKFFVGLMADFCKKISFITLIFILRVRREFYLKNMIVFLIPMALQSFLNFLISSNVHCEENIHTYN
jgi:hypothetical protein